MIDNEDDYDNKGNVSRINIKLYIAKCDYTVVSFYLYHSPSDDFYFGEIFQKPVFIFVYFSKNLMWYTQMHALILRKSYSYLVYSL